METLLNEMETIGVYGIFCILVLRELFAHLERRRGSGNGNGDLTQKVNDLTRWQVPRIEEAIAKLAEAQERQTRLLESLTGDGMRKTRLLERLIKLDEPGDKG